MERFAEVTREGVGPTGDGGQPPFAVRAWFTRCAARLLLQADNIPEAPP